MAWDTVSDPPYFSDAVPFDNHLFISLEAFLAKKIRQN